MVRAAAVDHRADAGQCGAVAGAHGVIAVNLNRILAAAGSVPADLDREQLLKDLDGIRSLYRTSVERRDAPAKQAQRNRKIIKIARNLQLLIEGWRLKRHRAARYHTTLEQLIADAENEFPDGLAPRLGALGKRQISAFEHLVGLMLRETYELHFKVKARFTNDPYSEETHGPFIDFAEAALSELGITNSGVPYSRRSIAAALSKVRKQ
jgi:hypothetical protein